MGNRKQTEQLLLDTVGQIIVQQGLAGLKVNDIALKAGVNKALIYRYFKGLNGLLETFAESQDFWPTTTEVLGENPADLLAQPTAKILRSLLANHLQALQGRPVTLAILAQECVERNKLTAILEEVREQRSMELQQYLVIHLQKTNKSEAEVMRMFALGAIFSGALQYFLIRSRFINIFGGLDIGSDAGFRQILDTIEASLS